MVQLKIQTNFVRLKFLLKEPSLSDCLDRSSSQRSGLVIKGTLKCVSEKKRDYYKVVKEEKKIIQDCVKPYHEVLSSIYLVVHLSE